MEGFLIDPIKTVINPPLVELTLQNLPEGNWHRAEIRSPLPLEDTGA